jgi:mannosyl-3-phosphoglycerate phosphatase
MSASKRWLIATDLDGTLLDDAYPLSEAALVIDSVSRAGNARVALASSKTLAELQVLAERCATRPFLVFENGAGVAWPSGELPEAGSCRIGGHEVALCGRPYPELRAWLATLRERRGFPFRGFGDLDADTLAGLTGLDATAAELARQRLSTEPILWEGDAAALVKFQRELATRSLRLVLGGRFHHVMPDVSKAGAISRLRLWLQQVYGHAYSLIACGDAPNDREMLELADRAVVFPGRDGNYLLPASDSVMHAAEPGPACWLASVERVLNSRSREARAP